MAERVLLIPDEGIGIELGDKPFVIGNCSKIVVSADEEGCWDADLIEWDLGWICSAIDFHILDMTEVVADIVLTLDVLSVIDEISVS